MAYWRLLGICDILLALCAVCSCKKKQIWQWQLPGVLEKGNGLLQRIVDSKLGEKSFDREVKYLMLGKGVKCIIHEEISEIQHFDLKFYSF